jgi:hypothetical protein
VSKENATIFYQEYIKLTDVKKDEFSRLTNKLLSCNYMTASSLLDKDDYYKIISDFQLFESYFSLMDYVLEHHSHDKVIHIYNKQNYNHYHFKKNESIILLLLRRYYYTKMQEVSLLDDITMTLEQLHDAMISTGIYDKRLNKTELNDILRVLKRFNIIDLNGKSSDDQSLIIIYPTINYVLPIEKIEEIETRLQDYMKRGDDNEKTSEDEID